MASPYEDLMEHARIFNRFASIPGHKHGKIAPPAPEPKPKQDAPEKPVEVSFAEAKKLESK